MTERRDIGWRLENWGKCYRTGSGGITARGRGTRTVSHRSPLVMTGIICDQLRSATFGSKASRSASLDYHDAKRIERAWTCLPFRERTILRLRYIWGASDGAICRKLDIPMWPPNRVSKALAQAQAMIADIVGPIEE